MPEPTGKPLAIAVEDKHRYSKGFVAALILSVVLGFIGLVTLHNNPHTTETFLFAGMCFIVPALICAGLVPWALASWIRGTGQFEIYKDGFILRNVKTNSITDSALWSEVEDILWSDVQKDQSSAMKAGVIFGIVGYLVATATQQNQEPDDKRVMVMYLPGRQRRVDLLFTSPYYVRTALGSVAFDAWLAETLSALEKGASVNFGNIQATPEGLKQAGQFVAWDSITDVTRKKDYVTVWWKTPTQKESGKFSEKLGDKGDVLIRVAQTKGKVAVRTPDRFKNASIVAHGSLSERLGRL